MEGRTKMYQDSIILLTIVYLHILWQAYLIELAVDLSNHPARLPKNIKYLRFKFNFELIYENFPINAPS